MADVGPPEGWYPDPFGTGLRYWDGGVWTPHRRQASGALIVEEPPSAELGEAAPPEKPSRKLRATTSTAVTLVAVAVLTLSLVLPWQRGEVFGQSVDENSFENLLPWVWFEGSFANGFIFLMVAGLLALLVVVVAYGFRAGGMGVLLLGAGMVVYLLLTALSFDDLYGGPQAEGVEVGIGVGLWLALVCSVVAAVGGFIALVERR